MSVFTQILNPITGRSDWELRPDDYDYHQEVARSSYADMLHDTERNVKYERALKIAIDEMHAKGKAANVLDIGTGTGLLSMMALENGADSVVACEAFRPMSRCALEIFEANGFAGKIRLFAKRSTELTEQDMPVKANVLVTEVFDTELIGEGALETFAHAHRVLLEKDCIVVPASATVFAQVVESATVRNWNKPRDVIDEDRRILLRAPDAVKNCPGAAAVHDLQLSQLSEESFSSVLPPVPVFRFDWSGKTPFIMDRKTVTGVKARDGGLPQAVFVWWELQMDFRGEIVLSCAPYWSHPLAKNDEIKHKGDLPWRDHWMQAVYYLPQEVQVEKDEEVNLIACHDEYSLWFNLKKDLKISECDYARPMCSCSFHIAFSRTRIGQLNDGERLKKYLSLIKNNVEEESTVLLMSSGFYPGLCAAKFGAKMLYVYESNFLSKDVMKKYAEFNKLDNVVLIEDLKQINENIDLVLSEPFFLTAILPWDNLLFDYLLNSVKDKLSVGAKIFPQRAVIKAIAVKFKDLHKIRSSLGKCEGFVMEPFDNLIKNSSNISDSYVEAQPLWEYPGFARSKIVEIATLEFNNDVRRDVLNNGCFILEGEKACANGVAIWVDWVMDSPGNTISTGPIAPVVVGQEISWDMHTRQGVCLFDSNSFNSMINFKFTYEYEVGNINFSCCSSAP